ncbi:MAG: nucleoside monophosphate kinase [Tepidisphaeraceae bacterium]
MTSSAVNDRATWLSGCAGACSHPPGETRRPWRLVLLGAPGVGKGTQAELLGQSLGACHLSTGDVFRAAKGMPEVQLGPAMRAALGYMKRGDLVPDSTVLDMVRERSSCVRCQGGFLLDGFPRTLAQAEALQKLLAESKVELDGVIDYQLPIDQIVARLSGRRTCTKCKTVFHVQTRPPKAEGICDSCGGPLIQREDDRPESVRVRMEAYNTSTKPLTDFYARLGKLIPVDADGSPEQILERTKRKLATLV